MTTTTSTELDPTPTFTRSLQALLQRADADTVPSGVLATLAASPMGVGTLRDGKHFTDTVDQRQWEAMHASLATSALAHAELLSGDAIQAQATADAEQGIVPIGLIHTGYHRPTRRLMANILAARRDDTAIDASCDPLLEERVAFAASAVLPHSFWGFERMPDVHEGLRVRFRLAPELLVTNREAPASVDIDFDDGLGFRSVAYGSEQVAEYDADGEKRIVLRLGNGTAEDAEVRTASFRFTVAASASPNMDEVFTVEAEIAHNGVKGLGRVVVFLGRGNARLTRPFIVAEGFPGGNTPGEMFDRLNGLNGTRFNPDARLGDAIRDRGYDLVFLFFKDGGTFIQTNAYVYLAALKEIWRRMGSKGDIVAGGGSMGGLIARYALAYAETHNVATGNVTALLTFDSPHLGANVPLSIQAVARFFANNKGAEDTIKLLDLPAAKQMLVAQRWTWDHMNEAWEKSTFTDFYAELGKLGVKGYPSKVKRYAISNGADDAASGIQPGHGAVVARWGLWHWPVGKAEAFSTPNGTPAAFAWCDAITERIAIRTYDVKGNGFYTRDGCAGGTADFFGKLATSMRNNKANVWTPPVTVSCFVPAYSALGVPVVNAFAFRARDLQPGATPFTEWYASTTNDAHATIDKRIKDWVLARFP